MSRFNGKKSEPFIIYEDGPPSACDCVKNAVKAGKDDFDKILQKRCEVYAEKLSREEKESRAIEGMKCLEQAASSSGVYDCGNCTMDIAKKMADEICENYNDNHYSGSEEMSIGYRFMIVQKIEQRPNCSYVVTLEIQEPPVPGLGRDPSTYISKRLQCDGKEMYVAD